MAKYAYILQGKVMYIEDRDVDIKNLVAPDLTDRFVPIPERATVRPGMIYSDGAFIDDPVTPPDIIAKYQNLLLQRDAQYKAVLSLLVATATTLTDAQALGIQRDFYPVWPNGVDETGAYRAGQVVTDNGSLYRVVQAVTPIESQPPHGEGRLAVYRPIDTGHAGTQGDPIPWVYGMDCHTGSYYNYSGVTYLCKGDMLPCVWYPDSGIWQWEVADE